MSTNYVQSPHLLLHLWSAEVICLIWFVFLQSQQTAMFLRRCESFQLPPYQWSSTDQLDRPICQLISVYRRFSRVCRNVKYVWGLLETLSPSHSLCADQPLQHMVALSAEILSDPGPGDLRRLESRAAGPGCGPNADISQLELIASTETEILNPSQDILVVYVADVDRQCVTVSGGMFLLMNDF